MVDELNDETERAMDEMQDRIRALEAQLATARASSDRWHGVAHRMEEERDAAVKRAEEAEASIERYAEALIWCSGSADFGPGGRARTGWMVMCAPLLEPEPGDFDGVTAEMHAEASREAWKAEQEAAIPVSADCAGPWPRKGCECNACDARRRVSEVTADGKDGR